MKSILKKYRPFWYVHLPAYWKSEIPMMLIQIHKGFHGHWQFTNLNFNWGHIASSQRLLSLMQAFMRFMCVVYIAYSCYSWVNTIIVSDCYQISSYVNSNVSGSYYKRSSTVYPRLDLQLYLYLYTGDATSMFNTYWAIGPSVGSALAVMTSNDLSTFPPSGWTTYDGTSNVADNITFSATCPIGKHSRSESNCK